MTRMLKSAALAVCLAGFSAPVSAETNWTGISVGVGIGAGAMVNELQLGPGPLLPPGLFSLNYDGIGGDGVFGSLAVGVDYQVHRKFVVGAFFDYDFANIETTFNFGIPPLGNLAISSKTELENQWTLGLRAGMLTTPDTLIYGLIGYTQAEISDPSFTISGPINFGFSATVPTFTGITFGGGIETIVFPNMSLKAEYRYTKFDAEHVTLPFGLDALVDTRLEPSLHTARVVASYKFNFDGRRTEPLK